MIFGIQRTRVLWGIVESNRCCRSGLMKAGWMIIVVFVGEFLNNVPVVWRIYPYLPIISGITREKTDAELKRISRCQKCSKDK